MIYYLCADHLRTTGTLRKHNLAPRHPACTASSTTPIHPACRISRDKVGRRPLHVWCRRHLHLARHRGRHPRRLWLIVTFHPAAGWVGIAFSPSSDLSTSPTRSHRSDGFFHPRSSNLGNRSRPWPSTTSTTWINFVIGLVTPDMPWPRSDGGTLPHLLL